VPVSAPLAAPSGLDTQVRLWLAAQHQVGVKGS